MLRTNLSKLSLLSPGERRLLFEAVLFLPLIHITLSLLNYYRLHRIMEKLVPLKEVDAGRSEPDIVQEAGEIARIVTIAAGHGFYKATCLRKSLLVWWFMRRRSIHGEICFGVRKIDGGLEAHAWVERDGFVINDSANVRENYRPLKGVFPPVKSGL